MHVGLQLLSYTALRVVAGGLFMLHGLQKVFGVLGGREQAILSQLGAAGVIEVATGLCIALGLWTRPLALLAAGEMAVAYFLAHHPRGPWPVANGGEPAVLYCFLFLYLATNGPGRVSLDRLLRQKP